MIALTAAEMRGLEQRAIDEIGIPSLVLMELAGKSVAESIRTRGSVDKQKWWIFAGTGKNGGDGFVVARYLHIAGAEVHVVLCGTEKSVKGDARAALEILRHFPVPVVEAADRDAFDRASDGAEQAVGLVDALVGTGLSRPIEGHLHHIITKLNQLPGWKVAVDIPSGLDADEGMPHGTAVKANLTVTLGFAKRGLISAPGVDYVGQVEVTDIGLPASLLTANPLTVLEPEIFALLESDFGSAAHKGRFGHVGVWAGCDGKAGAAALACRGALRAGAGLVTLAIGEEFDLPQTDNFPELMTGRFRTDIEANDAQSLTSLLVKKSSVLIGPGLATDEQTGQLFFQTIAQPALATVPMVIDADGLNHLASQPRRWPLSPHVHSVLTPHPGEAARLLDCTTAEVQTRRIASALQIAQRFSAVTVLKGARTVIAHPDGRVAVNPTGNAGLAAGGTGDVLAGMIAGLLARGLAPYDAACVGVYWHGAAADHLFVQMGKGFLASELADELPETAASYANELRFS